jgi:hypothetical protein
MLDSEFVRVRNCGGGRVHVQIGFMTLCLEPEQVAELVRKGREALEPRSGFDDRSVRWSTRMQ